jgi:energy-coupling factor transport system substrate-specific component
VAATAVYLAAFIGLGAALGHPILQLIHQGEHEALLAGVLLVGAAVVILLLRRRVQSVVRLDLAQWKQAFRWRRPTVVALSLIPFAIGLDYAGHALVKGASLPLFFDSAGAILVGLLAGPWIGGLAGFLTNLISASTVDPIAAPYSIVSLLLGFAAGIAGYLGWPRRRVGWLALAMLCFAIASIGSTPLNLAMYHGQSGVWLGDAIDRALVAAHLPPIVAAYVGEAAVDLPDKLLTVLVVFLIYRALPWQRSPRTTEAIAQARTSVGTPASWVGGPLASIRSRVQAG